MAILGDYIRIKHGFAFKGDYITTEDNGVVLVTPGNFEIGGGFKEKKCKFFSAEYPVDYVLHAGDLIVTMTDLSKQGDTLGFSAFVPNSNRTYLHNQRIGLVDVFNPEADKDYIYWFMRTPCYQKTIVATASGSTVKHTSPSRICDVKIELPPLDEQKKISSILRSIDDKIENNQKINDNLQQQAQALYQSWFVNYTPFEGIMPDAWYIGTLSDLADTIICGKTPSTKRSEYYGNEVPFITIPDMHNQIYAVSTERSLSKVGASSQSGKTLPRNSICVSCIGTAGLVCLVAEPSQTNQQINSIVPSPTASPYYIYLLAKTLSDTIQNLGSGGSTICNLNKGQFSAIEALVPSEKSMQEFDEIVNPLFEAIYINQIENLRLAELRDTLLPKLMSGEIDVPNIQL